VATYRWASRGCVLTVMLSVAALPSP